MLMRYTSPNGRIAFECEVTGGKMAFEVAAAIAELFEEPACGCCKSKNIKPSTRQHDDYKFYELQCGDCGARLAFGQSKDGKRLFPKRTDKDKKTLPNLGWSVYQGREGGSYRDDKEHNQTGGPVSQPAGNEGIPF